jgi:5'-methylthioadenosine phosphorylase
MEQVCIGIIGGSGLYQMPELTDVEEIRIDTPFGSPSDAFIIGSLENQRVAFLPRHGRGHRFTPTELPFRANIYAMKLLGVERILSASAVGSLREEYAPLDMVIPDQFFDRTRARAKESTFFGEGIVAHVSFAHPICSALGDLLQESCQAAGVMVHRGGTYICMEGPAFSTKAESNVYRSWGMDVIGMTNLQEAKLAREAEICYATLAMVTDYDCWHEAHEAVTVEMVVSNLQKNSQMAQDIIRLATAAIDPEADCSCRHALATAVMTQPKAMKPATKKKLALLLGKYQRGH